MSQYKKWEMLNEALGFPLGVKSAASLGVVSDYGSTLEEGKKKKKMDIGDEISVDDDEDDDDDSDDAEVVAVSKHGHDGGECSCSDSEDDGKGLMMCKKCKKKMKKKMKNEDSFSSYEGAKFNPLPAVNSDEYRQQFWKSLGGHFGDPNKRFDGGVNLGEEVIFEPEHEVNSRLEAKPGQPGFAPVARVGASNWETNWTQIAEAMQDLAAKVGAMNSNKKK